MQKLVVDIWNFIFDHEVSPLKNIPDLATRHMVFQLLGWMWAGSFAIATGSYILLPASLVAHAVLIAAAAVTVATYTTAALRPEVFTTGSGRRRDGEHV